MWLITASCENCHSRDAVDEIGDIPTNWFIRDKKMWCSEICYKTSTEKKAGCFCGTGGTRKVREGSCPLHLVRVDDRVELTEGMTVWEEDGSD